MAGPLPVALILRLDHELLHLKPQAEEGLQLGDINRLKFLAQYVVGLYCLTGSAHSFVCLHRSLHKLALRKSLRKESAVLYRLM